MAEGSFAAGLVGITLDDRYRLDALVGEGGMGAVYRATHLAMDRRVAVKLLKPHLTADATQLQRFAREARSTLKVDSPHAVKVLDFGVTPLRDYYMVLEYLDGRTVQRELDIDGPFAPTRAVHIARQALHALGAAHRSGLVHRDVKPDNLLLMRQGGDPDYAKVLDFGVAKLMEGAPRSDRSALALTQAGMVFGTPEFMSPEQACGHALDGRSDLYSLAATLFTMLTGRGLFDGKSPIEWLTHHARTPPPRLAMVQPALASYPELDDLLQVCLAKQRDRRPRTAEDMDGMLAAIWPILHAGRAAPSIAGRQATQRSPSSYIATLPSDTLEPVPPSLAAAPPEPADDRLATAPTPSNGEPTGLQPIQHRRGRGVVLALGAVAVLAMIGVALGIALGRHGARDAPRRGAVVIADAPPDAAPAATGSVDAAVATTADAAVAPPRTPDAAPRRAIVTRRPDVDEHVRNAEQARRASNHLKQLAEADLALRADPRNRAARYLFGDALIKTGNIEQGCKYLRPLRRHPTAQAVATAAGCPTD